MEENREKMLLDIDSDLKKSKGFVVIAVTQTGRITVYDLYKDLNGVEKMGLLSATIEYATHKSKGDWNTLKDYEAPLE